MIATENLQASYTLRQIVMYMLRLGTLGFGGPVALVGYMHRDLVEQRTWINEADYKEGLVLAQNSIIDLPTIFVAVATVVLLWRFKKLKEPVIVAGAAIIGLLVYPLWHA